MRREREREAFAAAATRQGRTAGRCAPRPMARGAGMASRRASPTPVREERLQKQASTTGRTRKARRARRDRLADIICHEFWLVPTVAEQDGAFRHSGVGAHTHGVAPGRAPGGCLVQARRDLDLRLHSQLQLTLCPA